MRLTVLGSLRDSRLLGLLPRDRLLLYPPPQDRSSLLRELLSLTLPALTLPALLHLAQLLLLLLRLFLLRLAKMGILCPQPAAPFMTG